MNYTNYFKNIALATSITTCLLFSSMDSNAQTDSKLSKKHKKSLEEKVFEKTGEYHSLEMPKDLEQFLISYDKKVVLIDSTIRIGMMILSPSDSSEQFITIANTEEYYEQTYNNREIILYNSIPDKKKDYVFTASYKLNNIQVGISQGYNRGKFDYSINGKKMSVELDKDLTFLVFVKRTGNYNELEYLLFDKSMPVTNMSFLRITNEDIMIDYKDKEKNKSFQSVGKITRETFN